MALKMPPEKIVDKNLVRDSSIYIKCLQKGCVCGVSNLQFANFIFRGNTNSKNCLQIFDF